MGKFGFQNLEVYQLAKELVIDIYKATNSFPSNEKYALAQQMNRSAVSIPSNIAEGYSRFSDKEKIHFLNMAYGSLMELTCHYEISNDLDYISQKDFDNYITKANNLAVKINNFRSYIKNKK
ncbi:MAG: hypothetical protein DDT40_00405 [candidate division WS2 bacterium]|nr:hypothetical protein [Candidatus Psychracetigena formicireducens]